MNTITETGLTEILAILKDNYVGFTSHTDASNWASEVEASADAGNGTMFELSAFETHSGVSMDFVLSPSAVSE